LIVFFLTGPPPNGILSPSGQGSAQSLPRELSLNEDAVLMQRFVPELQALRGEHMAASGVDAEKAIPVGLSPVEVLASFPSACGSAAAGCGLLVLGSGSDPSWEGMEIGLRPALGLITINATTLKNPAVRAGPLPPGRSEGGGWDVHVYVDHSVIEVIVNNETAFVVYGAPSEASTQGNVALYGLPSTGQGATLDVWKLKDANIN